MGVRRMINKKLFVFLVMLLTQVKAQKREGDTCVEQNTNIVGKCKPADTCESARNDFQINGIRPTFCTYSAFGVTLVCCRDGVSILHTAEPKITAPIWNVEPNRQADTRRVSERSDKEMTSAFSSAKENYHGYQFDAYEKEIPVPSRKDTNEKEREEFSEKEIEFVSKVWWLKLRKLNPEQRRYAEKIINDILYYAEVDKLTNDHLDVMQSAFSCNKNEN